MISLLFPKKNIMRSTLLEGMTDVHTHLLPGVDDGFEKQEEALKMLTYMSEIGIRRVFLTPHISDEQLDNTSETLSLRFEQFKRMAPSGIELHLAAEYMLDTGFRSRVATGLLSLPGGRALVETSYLAAPLDLFNLLYDLSLEGYTPVIAHPERYLYMSDVDSYLLKSKGYKFQLNLFSLCGFYGTKVRKKAETLLKQGFYSYVGSDCHDMETYKKGLRYLFLSRLQLEKLSRLVDNNNSL